MDAHVPFQTAEEGLRQMDRVPLVKGFPQALAQLVEDRLRQHRQGHLPEPDVEIQGARTVPAEVLIEAKELLNVPMIRKTNRQGWHLRAGRRAAEAFEVIVLRTLAGALNGAVTRFGHGAAPGREWFSGVGQTGPVTDEGCLGQGAVVTLERAGLAQRHQQVKRGVLAHLIQQFHREVLAVRHQEGARVLGRVSVFPGSGASSPGPRRSCAAGEKSNRRRKVILRNQGEEAGAAACAVAAVEEFGFSIF